MIYLKYCMGLIMNFMGHLTELLHGTLEKLHRVYLNIHNVSCFDMRKSTLIKLWAINIKSVHFHLLKLNILSTKSSLMKKKTTTVLNGNTCLLIQVIY